MNDCCFEISKMTIYIQTKKTLFILHAIVIQGFADRKTVQCSLYQTKTALF